jgi:DNA-binding SARP family transcriptional activator
MIPESGESWEIDRDTARDSLKEPNGLSIRLFGGFELSVNGRTVEESEWYLRKARSLVKLLALAPSHRLHRGELMELLWPTLHAEAAANNLHKVLHVARRVLEPTLSPNTPSAFLHMSEEFVTFRSPGSLTTDVQEFRAAAHQARLTQDSQCYESALALYRGELLPEDRYEDWVAREREDLQGLYAALLLELANLHEVQGDMDKAIVVLGQAVATDPAHEQAQATLMKLYASRGSRHLALRQYKELCDALREELGVEPADHLQVVYQQILSGATQFSDTHRRPTGLRPSAVTAPFVGRGYERARCSAILDALFAGHGTVLSLLGPMGIGKSRLAAEIGKDATTGGAIVLWGACYECEGNASYAPLSAALEGFALRLPPSTLLELAGDFVPELASLAPRIAQNFDGSKQVIDDARMLAAVAHFFTKLGEHAPVVMILEDLQAADQDTIRVLAHLSHMSRQVPLLVLGTIRHDGADASEHDTDMSKFLHEASVEILEVPSLSRTDVEWMVKSLLHTSVDQSVLDLVHSLAQGNPYHVEETIRALQGRRWIYSDRGHWRLEGDNRRMLHVNNLRQRSRNSGDYRLRSVFRQ